MTESEFRRRRRPAVSCSSCRRRKLRCSREIPCTNCTRSKASCVYDRLPPISAGTSQNSTGSVSQSSVSEIESLKSRIRELEHDLTASSAGTFTSSDHSIIHLGEALELHPCNATAGQPLKNPLSVSHKNRLFGQSHWISTVSLFQDICEQVGPSFRQDTGKVASGLQRCKALGRVIKSQQEPVQNTPTSQDLPHKGIADDLVDCYLRTSESVYRVLHVPSFRQSYEALWISGSETDTSFRFLLKLVMAIGAVTYDEYFSMRASAVRWVYEAHAWLSSPRFKAQLNIQSLQVNILLLIAREVVAVGGTLIWISAGSLLRRAMSMGLHVDPTSLPSRSVFAMEMHRRLWNTIVEIALRASLSSGSPPRLSLDDFDTQPPGNFDDDQLMAEDPVPKPEDQFTQISVAIALRKSFPVRLAVVKFLNDFGSKSTFEETLHLDAKLREAFRVLHQNLQVFTTQPGGLPSSAVEIQIVRFMMHRWILALHVPYFGPALRDTSYAYSKSVVVDMSLNVWCAVHPSSLPDRRNNSINAVNSASSSRNELGRLATCGSGFYRTVAFHACLLTTAALHSQLQEVENTGFSAPLRPDLLAVLDDAKTWCLKCLEAGETNIKGYIFMGVLKAAINGPLQSTPKEQMMNCVIQAAEDCVCQSLPILEQKAAEAGARNGLEMDLPLTGSESSNMDDWDFMTSDPALFIHWDDTEPINWGFYGES